MARVQARVRDGDQATNHHPAQGVQVRSMRTCMRGLCVGACACASNTMTYHVVIITLAHVPVCCSARTVHVDRACVTPPHRALRCILTELPTRHAAGARLRLNPRALLHEHAQAQS